MHHLVLQTNFGTADGAVSAMYGISFQANSEPSIAYLAHDIPQYNVWVGAFASAYTLTRSRS